MSTRAMIEVIHGGKTCYYQVDSDGYPENINPIIHRAFKLGEFNFPDFEKVKRQKIVINLDYVYQVFPGKLPTFTVFKLHSFTWE